MSRVTKEPQVRMAEILDMAENLFYAKGYHETQISDIVKAIGVAQGTFYYYFKSKEEILEALINRQIHQVNFEMEKLTSDDRIDPLRKLELHVRLMFHTIRYKDGLLFEFLYNDRYLHLMDKLTRQGKTFIAPFLLHTIDEGRKKGTFQVNHPEVVQTFVIGIMHCLFDLTYEKPSAELYAKHVEMALALIEKAVGLPDHTLKLSMEDLAISQNLNMGASND